MNSKQTTCAIALVLLAASGPAVAEESLHEDYAGLEGAANENPQAWFDLAVRAREAGDTETASRALERAESLQFSPVRLGLEKARIAVLRGARDEALAELSALAAGGFTAVQALTGDPLLSRLSGKSEYDTLVEEMTRQAFPCEHDGRFDEFDFWIGEWEVHDAGGNLAGRNSIRPAERGCVLVEKWSSATGGSGMSMNYLDHDAGEWVQVWIDSSGGQIEIRGGPTEEGMLLEGEIHYTATDTTAPFRGLWTPLPDGRVRQFFEQSNDGGESWVTWFEGFYTRTSD